MPGEPQIDSDMRTQSTARPKEVELALLAERQHGVVARWQLLARGFEPGAVTRRIERRRLHVVHRGVYAVGHPVLTPEGRWMAAVLAGGPGSTLSHRSAAAHHGVIEAGRTVADVTAPTRRSSRPGIDLHEGVLPEDERTIHDGIPVTTVARTLLDLATVLDDERLAQAVGKAEALGLGDTTSLPDLMCRYPSRRGAVALRAILADARIGMDLARSELEIRFLAFLRDRDLPRPEVNVPITARGRRIVVDCLWREARLVVELDSRAHHSGWRAADADRARDFALVAAGMRTARVTWRRLHQDAGRLEAELRAVLDAGAPRP
jgi:very-short-patch-repair endonuclease/predicted transcriptional regulator of viral defense system